MPRHVGTWALLALTLALSLPALFMPQAVLAHFALVPFKCVHAAWRALPHGTHRPPSQHVAGGARRVEPRQQRAGRDTHYFCACLRAKSAPAPPRPCTSRLPQLLLGVACLLYLAPLAEDAFGSPQRLALACAVPVALGSTIVWLGAIVAYVRTFDTAHL